MWLGSSVGIVLAQWAGGAGFESRSGHDFFLPCDIWWLGVGSQLGPRASGSACLVVPPLFRADSGTNLIKQGEKCQRTTKWLGSSVGGMLARWAGGPGFESRSGHDVSSPVTHVLKLFIELLSFFHILYFNLFGGHRQCIYCFTKVV